VILSIIGAILPRLSEIDYASVVGAANRNFPGNTKIQKDIHDDFAQTKEHLTQAKNILQKDRRYLSTLDFLEYNLLLLCVLSAGATCLFFLFGMAFR